MRCKRCQERITEDNRVKSMPESDMGYPILSDDGFWEYLYICPKCGARIWASMPGQDDYPDGGFIQ